MPAVEIRDRETGLVSEPFSWFQSGQIFHETHEIKANPILFLQFDDMGSIIQGPGVTYDKGAFNNYLDKNRGWAMCVELGFY